MGGCGGKQICRGNEATNTQQLYALEPPLQAIECLMGWVRQMGLFSGQFTVTLLLIVRVTLPSPPSPLCIRFIVPLCATQPGTPTHIPFGQLIRLFL